MFSRFKILLAALSMLPIKFCQHTMETNQSAFSDWDKWFARANERSELAINPTLLGTVAVVAPMLNTVHMPLRWILGWRAPGLFSTGLEKRTPWSRKSRCNSFFRPTSHVGQPVRLVSRLFSIRLGLDGLPGHDKDVVMLQKYHW